MKTIIDNDVYASAKASLKRMGGNAVTVKKLHCVIASYKHGIKKVSEVFGVSKASIYLWARQIKEGNTTGLINKAKLQDGIKLKQKHKAHLSRWLEEDPTLSIKKVLSLLKDKCAVVVSKSTAHRAMVSCGFSYITPRKQHYKQDKKQVESFKKGSS